MATQNEGNKIVTNGLYLYGKHERVRNGKDVGKNYQLQWLGNSNLLTACNYPSEITDEESVLPFCYMNALIQIATDRADIPIGQSNRILIFFSFPQSENIFVLARDGRTLEDLSLASLSSSTFDSSNFLLTIKCNNGQHKFKQGISFAVESWDKITLNPATINIT